MNNPLTGFVRYFSELDDTHCPESRQQIHEERLNVITHKLALIVSIIGLAVMAGFALKRGSWWHALGVCSFSLFLVFSVWRLYAVPQRADTPT